MVDKMKIKLLVYTLSCVMHSVVFGTLDRQLL